MRIVEPICLKKYITQSAVLWGGSKATVPPLYTYVVRLLSPLLLQLLCGIEFYFLFNSLFISHSLPPFACRIHSFFFNFFSLCLYIIDDVKVTQIAMKPMTIEGILLLLFYLYSMHKSEKLYSKSKQTATKSNE